MVRQILAWLLLMVTGWSRQLGEPESCPQEVGPLSSRAAVTGPAAGAFFGWGPATGGADGQPGGRAHRDRDVPVPRHVLADLVVVEGDLVLGGLEGFLHRYVGS